MHDHILKTEFVVKKSSIQPIFDGFSTGFPTFFPNYPLSRRNCPVDRIQSLLVDKQIRQSEQSIEMRCVLGHKHSTDTPMRWTDFMLLV